MLKNVNPVTTNAWKKLEQHYTIMKANHMVDMFAVDPSRFAKFSLHFEDILVDFSKNIINDQTLEALLELAEEAQLKDAIEQMFSGDKINLRESRRAQSPLRGAYSLPQSRVHQRALCACRRAARSDSLQAHARL